MRVMLDFEDHIVDLPISVPLAAVIAMLLLAFGVSRVGLAPAVFVAATIAARGVVRTGWRQAIVAGACVTLAAILLFTLALRQPWPLWPRLAMVGF